MITDKQKAKIDLQVSEFKKALVDKCLKENTLRITPPEGQEWNRNDYTIDDLGDDYRPLLKGEELQGSDEVSHGEVWYTASSELIIASLSLIKIRTKRPLPPLPVKQYWNNPDHVPNGVCWLRIKGGVVRYLISSVTTEGIKLHPDRISKWCTIQNYEWAYAVPGELKWRECTV